MNNYIKYKNELSFKNKFFRILWSLFNLIFLRSFSLPLFYEYRNFCLKLFGAKIGNGCRIHSSVKIWAPWNLELGNLVSIGYDTVIYNPGKIIIKNKVSISQRCHICSASHDYTKKTNPLIVNDIIINDFVWIATDVFVGMGVEIGEGVVIGATSSVYKNIDKWNVVGGNPVKFIKKRIIND